MAESFGDRLVGRVREYGPLCVGIDPSATALDAWGRPDSVEGLEFFSLTMLEAAVGVAAAIKPQVAYFERFGSAGYAVLERLLRDAREAHVLTVADAKRGDIGPTNEGYAAAWLDDDSPLSSDAVTLTGYIGLEALTPFYRRVEQGRGVFVLAATSNEEGRELQRARTESGEHVESLVLRTMAERNAAAEGLGGYGVVLGATRTRPEFDLATLRGPYLVPGVGAQGATPDQVGRLFERCVKGSVLVNVSRAVASAGPERRGLRDVTRYWRDELAAAL
jgi:orotidine-5'-phosphate decarboxylase